MWQSLKMAKKKILVCNCFIKKDDILLQRLLDIESHDVDMDIIFNPKISEQDLTLSIIHGDCETSSRHGSLTNYQYFASFRMNEDACTFLSVINDKENKAIPFLEVFCGNVDIDSYLWVLHNSQS